MRLRLERVKQLLEETSHPLSRIAGLAGIEQPEQLGRLFRRKFGKTPGEYQQAIRDLGRRPDHGKFDLKDALRDPFKKTTPTREVDSGVTFQVACRLFTMLK